MHLSECRTSDEKKKQVTVMLERVNELIRSRQQQQYSRTFRSEDLHQLVTQLNTDYSTTSLYRKNDVMNNVIDIADN